MIHSIRSRSVARGVGAMTAGLLLTLAAMVGVTGSTAAANTPNTAQDSTADSAADSAAHSAASSMAGTAGASGAPAAGLDVAPGSGTLYFDWGCSGSYGSTSIVFNANGTFAIGDGNTGLWYRNAGILMFTFTNFRTTYALNVSGSIAIGIHSSFLFAPPAGGCSYVVQTGGFAAAPAGLGTEDLDAVGNPVKR